MTNGGDDWKPKRIVFPSKEIPAKDVDDHRPKPIIFPPKNNSVKSMTNNSDSAPKAVSFGSPPKDQNNGSAPKAASFQNKVNSSPKPTNSPSAISFASNTPVASDQAIEQRTGMKIKTPEEAKFERMVSVATSLNPSVASRPGFVKRLTALSQMEPRDVINWGNASLQTNKLITDKLAEITRDLSFLEVSRWLDETRTEATKPPSKGFFDRFKPKGPGPEFFEQKLVQIRKTLDEIISVKLDKALREFDDTPDVFAMEVLALKVWSESLTNAVNMQLADNRYRMMLAAEQGILVTKQILGNLQVTVTTSIQQIDELTLTVIPNWKVAHAHSN